MQYTFIDPFSRTNYDFEGIHQGQGPSRSAILDRHEPQSWMNPRKADMQLRFFPRVISTFMWLRSLSPSRFRFSILFLYHLCTRTVISTESTKRQIKVHTLMFSSRVLSTFLFTFTIRDSRFSILSKLLEPQNDSTVGRCPNNWGFPSCNFNVHVISTFLFTTIRDSRCRMNHQYQVERVVFVVVCLSCFLIVFVGFL